jgi:predicted transcriptional regulator
MNPKRRPKNRPTAVEQLSWRERQVFEALLESESANAQEVRGRLPDPPSYSAVRAILAKLERKGLARHEEKGMRYVYSPVVSREGVQRSALTRLVRVFFEGSAAAAATGLVRLSAGDLSEAELDELERVVARAREGLLASKEEE